jgi:hypothetical protein
MYLSTDALRDLMQRAAAQTASADDKRRAGRVLTRSQVLIVHCGTCTTANLADVSHRGVSLFSRSKMKRGDTFILRLRSDTAPAQILCTVVHCRPINIEMFKIGAEFTCTLPSEPNAKPAAVPAVKPPPSPAKTIQDEVARIRQSILN